MVKDFQFIVAQKVIFGVGSLSRLPEILAENSSKKVLIISGKVLTKLGVVKKVTDIVKASGISFEVFNDVEANPSIETVEKALEVYNNSGATSIIALGGGSPMDTTKAVPILATYGGKITDYEGGGKVPGEIVPLIAIPTTAGSGSEVTAFSVITDKSRNYKLTVFSYNIIPKYVLLAPQLILSAPQTVASSTGIDALVHAIESYLSKGASPFSDAMAEKAIAEKAMELIGKNIRQYVADRTNLESASAMMLGSTFAGIAFAWARLGNVHAMAHPLGGFFNIPHGVANAILLPIVLEYNSLSDSGRYEKIYNYISKNPKKDFTSSMLVDEVFSLNKELCIPKNLSEVGVTEDKILEMSLDAIKSGNIAVNPRSTTLADIQKLYYNALI